MNGTGLKTFTQPKPRAIDLIEYRKRVEKSDRIAAEREFVGGAVKQFEFAFTLQTTFRVWDLSPAQIKKAKGTIERDVEFFRFKISTKFGDRRISPRKRSEAMSFAAVIEGDTLEARRFQTLHVHGILGFGQLSPSRARLSSYSQYVWGKAESGTTDVLIKRLDRPTAAKWCEDYIFKERCSQGFSGLLTRSLYLLNSEY